MAAKAKRQSTAAAYPAIKGPSITPPVVAAVSQPMVLPFSPGSTTSPRTATMTGCTKAKPRPWTARLA